MHSLPINPLLAGVIHQAFITEHTTVAQYRVLPSAFTVIGFQFSGRIHHAAEGRPLDTFGVTGILEQWRPFRSDASTRSLLIFFKPGGFYRIFGPVAGALGSASLALGDVVTPGLRRDFSDLLSAPTPVSQKWRALQERLLKLMQRDLSPETYGALYQIDATRGILPVTEIAATVGVSRRTLERKFAAEVGSAPKHLARIVRWRHAIQSTGKYPDLATCALTHGYFDQAHFIRETRLFAGEVPSRLSEKL